MSSNFHSLVKPLMENYCSILFVVPLYKTINLEMHIIFFMLVIGCADEKNHYTFQYDIQVMSDIH